MEIVVEDLEILRFYSKLFAEVHVSPHGELIQGVYRGAGQM